VAGELYSEEGEAHSTEEEGLLVRELLETAFLETDESYMESVRKSGSPPSMVRSGSTAMVCYISPDLGMVHVANAGDCRAVLATDGGLPKAVPFTHSLTHSHSHDNPHPSIHPSIRPSRGTP